MRWMMTTSDDGQQGRAIGGARTLREAMEWGRCWLERHPGAQRCYAHDTRKGRSTPITRKRVAHRHSDGTHKDRRDK